MRIEQFEAIVAIADKKSMQKAADSLYTSIQNISKLVKQLEDELQTQIFIRNKYGLFLTQEGEHILKYAQNILDSVEVLRKTYILHDHESISLQKIPNISILSAHANTVFASSLLTVLCDEFQVEQSALIVKDAIEINQQLISDPCKILNNYELIITNLLTDEMTVLKRFAKNIPIFVLRKDRIGVKINIKNSLNNRESISIKEIIEQPLIIAQPDSNSFSHLQSAIESLGVTLKPKYIVNSAQLCHNYIQKNLGYTIITHNEEDTKNPFLTLPNTVNIPLREPLFVTHIIVVNPHLSEHSCYQRILSIINEAYPVTYQLL